MAKRIVQMLVTCAVEDDRTRAEVRAEIADALTVTMTDGLIVELVESRSRSYRNAGRYYTQGEPTP